MVKSFPQPPPLTNKLISKKKVAFPVTASLQAYLNQHGRAMSIPVTYEDLLRFEGSMAILDKDDRDTLWVDCLYPQGERDELVTNLKRLYSILHADGSDTILPFLTVDSIAYCTFGNTKPFRIKVRNIINDNYLFLYVKRCDAFEDLRARAGTVAFAQPHQFLGAWQHPD